LLITGVLKINSTNPDISVLILDHWPSLIFRQRAPFNWEPIGILSLGFFQVFLAIPNIIVGAVLSMLVGLNIAVSAYTYSNRGRCNISPTKSIIAATPALLTGVACCGPSLLISLGLASATLSVAFVALLPFIMPLALFGLLGSLFWSGYKLNQDACTLDELQPIE
jgi:hypothetical protein